MREINAAWSVLSDPNRRAAYDLSLRRSAVRPTGPVVSQRPPARPSGAPRPAAPSKPRPKVATHEEMEVRGLARIIRPLPLLAIGAIVSLVIVLTAAFGSGSGETPRDRLSTPTGTPLGCIDLSPLAVEVPCGDHEAVVWSLASPGETCPSDLEAIYRDGVGGLFCVTLVD